MTAPDTASPEVGVRAILIGDAALNAFIGGRVYVDEAEQGHERPAIVVKLVSRAGVATIEGPSGLASYRLQLDLIADRAEHIRSMRNQVRLLLDGYSGTAGGQDFDSVQWSNEVGRFDFGSKSRIRILDFICWCKDGTQ